MNLPVDEYRLAAFVLGVNCSDASDYRLKVLRESVIESHREFFDKGILAARMVSV